MPSRYTAQTVGTGLHARSLLGHAVAKSAVGRALAAELSARYAPNAAPAVGMSLGRLVVVVRRAGLAGRPPAEQLVEARWIAAATRAHFTAGPWYTRRLGHRALTAVFEDHTVEDGCVVLRYVECTVPAPGR